MRPLANQTIKRLFLRILLALAVFAVVSWGLVSRDPEHAAAPLAAATLLLALVVVALLYGYFRAQSRLLNEAIAQVQEYLAGNVTARIACNEEGDLYRLFHAVNALATILSAHAEEERRAKTLLKETIADISHQLKTPLAALNIYHGLLQQESSPAVQELLTLSEQELDRMDTLVQNLLKLAKLDAGTIVFEKSPQRVSELMACLEQRFFVRAKQEGKIWTVSGEEEVTLCCDPGWLTEAMSNLIKNAFDHTKAGDAIRVSWRTVAAAVQIVVSDTGSGIHPEDLPHIFKRFYRSRFSQDTQGVGLGLPLAKAILEAHDGTVEVDSALQAGTTVTIQFWNPTKM